MPSIIAIGDWGRCLQLDKVTQNMSLSYEINVKPNIEIYPTDKVLRSRTFNVQGECKRAGGGGGGEYGIL